MRPGTIVADRYRCDHLLGRGGMGEVHAAVDLRTDRRVAVKVMLGHRLDSAEARARFAREAKVGARIDSPYMVEVHDAGVDTDETPFLVMELLDGEDLEHRLARLGPRPAAEVVEHLAQVALALDRMRTARVVHRDLKPSNLFLQDRRGEPARVKVLDLGIAKELSDSAGHTTGIAGTPLYMAPEQIAGAPVSPATDLYALGLIAFTLLTGAPYWTRSPDEEPIAFAVRMKDGPITTASVLATSIGSSLPTTFDAWFARATARRPERRFPTATAALHALATALSLSPPEILPAVTRDSNDASPDNRDDADPVARADSGTVTARPDLVAGLSPPAPSIASRRSSPSRRWVAAPLTLIAVGAIVAWRYWPTPSFSPLAASHTVLACPVFEVDGDVAVNGWLGAAAAALTCERARVILGGSTARTLLPAELLSLAPEPQDGFPIDPYASPLAHEATRAAARSRADAYVDGAVTHDLDGFRVTLILRRRDGTAVATASGRSPALLEAVRVAMTPLVGAGALPLASALEPAVADHAGTSDVVTALDHLDLALGFAGNAGTVGPRCDEFARAHPGMTDREQLARWTCRYALGLATAPFTHTAEASTPGALTTRARIDYLVLRERRLETIARLRLLYASEPAPWSRALIAATLSCLLQGEPGETERWARTAVQLGAKNPIGEWCAPWEQLLSLQVDVPEIPRAMQAWQPWHAYAWAYDRTSASRLAYSARAFLLSPLDTTIARRRVDELLLAKRPEEAVNVARRVATGGYPAHALAADLFDARIAANRLALDNALARAQRAMLQQPDDEGWVRSQRREAAVLALEIAVVLGRGREVADAAIAGLVSSGAPSPGIYPDEPRWLAALCVHASPGPARACVARLDALVPGLANAERTETTSHVEGARRYVAGDHKAAAAAWRPIVLDRAYGELADVMVDAFAAAKGDELVDEIADHAPVTFAGVSMAMARAALAAHARGDTARADQLARRVLAAWSSADNEIPILADLRRIVR